MKRLLLLILCLLILFVCSSCGSKDNDTNNVSISDIPTAEADKADKTDKDDEKTDGEKSAEEFDAKYSDDEDEKYTDSKTSSTDYRSEKERVEIESGIKDAQDLVANGDYEDAMMLIKSLKTRKLSESESKILLELQKQMISITD